MMLSQVQKLKSSSSHFPGVDEFKAAQNLKIDFTFYIEIAGSNSLGERNLKLWGLIPCNIKPDLDNLEKFYLDCLNETVYSDDKCVTELSSRKIYSDKPRTEIVIKIMDEVKANIQMHEIMQIFSPDNLSCFLEDLRPVIDLFAKEGSEKLIEIMHKSDHSDQKINIATTAYVLSKVAERYGKLLLKVKTKCPDLYLGFEKIAENEHRKQKALECKSEI